MLNKKPLKYIFKIILGPAQLVDDEMHFIKIIFFFIGSYHGIAKLTTSRRI